MTSERLNIQYSAVAYQSASTCEDEAGIQLQYYDRLQFLGTRWPVVIGSLWIFSRSSLAQSPQEMQSTTTADFLTLAKIARITRICQLVPSVVMVYDYCRTDMETTQDDDHNAISRCKSSFCSRGIGPSQPAALAAVLWYSVWCVQCRRCNTFMIVQGWPACFLVWLVQVILQLRLYALYNRSRKVLIFMGSAFLVEILAMTTILIIANLTSGTSNKPVANLYPASRDDIGFIPPSNRVFLLDVLVKGNVGYFLVIFFVGVVNAVMWGALSPEWVEVPEGFPHGVAVIAGCRLILHIRNAATPPSEDTFQGSLAFEYPLQQRSAISASTV
ncbi:hypothetical protein EDD16DRAFT_1524606 [Pisolithus croceorrhizus]|nr:hypothetical protein EDD16DRAFT_1524606 [Pisolithus croceorrhizus]